MCDLKQVVGGHHLSHPRLIVEHDSGDRESFDPRNSRAQSTGDARVKPRTSFKKFGSTQRPSLVGPSGRKETVSPSG